MVYGWLSEFIMIYEDFIEGLANKITLNAKVRKIYISLLRYVDVQRDIEIFALRYKLTDSVL